MLTVIHLVGIPLDGTSVNPARSIGPALFNGGDSLAHLWVFMVFPLVGGAIAAVVAPMFETAIPKVTSTRPEPPFRTCETPVSGRGHARTLAA